MWPTTTSGSGGAGTIVFIEHCFRALSPEAPVLVPECRDHMPMKETRTPCYRLILNDVAALRDVETVQELTDILVADTADLLDIGGALGDILEGLRCVSLALTIGSEKTYVAGELELILLVGGDLDINTGAAQDAADDLLADEVPDLDLVLVILLLKVDVDGETGRRVRIVRSCGNKAKAFVQVGNAGRAPFFPRGVDQARKCPSLVEPHRSRMRCRHRSQILQSP